MSRKKLIRIKETAKLPNVFAPDRAKRFRGKWKGFVFGNSAQLVLELGCGKAEYALGLSKLHPQNNYIGMDRKADRIWVGATKALDEGLENARFIHGNITKIDQLFSAGEVAEIWITFPDPYPKSPARRLTSDSYLQIYKRILGPKALLHLKTDDEPLFNYSVSKLQTNRFAILFSSKDLHDSSLKDQPAASIETTYEKRHIAAGKAICYLTAQKDE